MTADNPSHDDSKRRKRKPFRKAKRGNGPGAYPNQHKRWLATEDELLLHKHAIDGLSFFQIGRRLGRTGPACEGRYRQIKDQ